MCEVLDTTIDCVVASVGFDITDFDEIGKQLGILSFNGDQAYPLDRKQAELLNHNFNLSLNIQSDALIRLRTAHWTDALPYRIHTNSELGMMLAGVKPLAAFHEIYQPSSISLIPEERFDPYVAQGRLIKREYIELRFQSRIRRVLYAQRGEEWRIDAYILMLQVADKTGWNNGLERMEGYLLGYEEWQCDAYFVAKQARSAKSG